MNEASAQSSSAGLGMEKNSVSKPQVVIDSKDEPLFLMIMLALFITTARTTSCHSPARRLCSSLPKARSTLAASSRRVEEALSPMAHGK